MNRSVRRAIIPSHVTLLKRGSESDKSTPETPKRGLGSSGRWKSFVGEVQAKLKSVTGNE